VTGLTDPGPKVTGPQRVRRAPASVQAMLDDCEQLAHAEPGNIQQIGALLQDMILRYYADVRSQAQQSFWAALSVAVAGIAFFVWAIWHQMSVPTGEQLTLKLVAGGLIQMISGTIFVLYGRATRQFGSFHVCLERTNRFLLANTICETLSATMRDDIRKELISIIARAPMVPSSTIGRGTSDLRAEQGAAADAPTAARN